MYKALACHAGGLGLNLVTTKEEKIISAPITISCHSMHSFSQWLRVTQETGDLLWERYKIEFAVKNPISAI